MLKERTHFIKDLFLSNALLKRPKIFWASIYLTYSCNYRCRHCYGKYGVTYGPQYDPENELDFEQMYFIVEKLHKYGCRYIALLGGEPLLHKEIKKIIDMIRSFGIELTIITNGSLVSSKINEIKNATTLCFSIDGNEESNDFLRGKGAYGHSLQALSKARQYGLNIHINATIYKRSIDNMDALFDYAKKNRIYLGFCPLMYQSYLDDECEYLRPSDEDYRRFYNKVIWLKRHNYPIMYSIYSYKTMLNWPDFNKVIVWKDDPFDIRKIGFPECCAGKNYIYISAKGDIYPCSQLIQTNAFYSKNIFKDGFENAWDNAKNIPCKACTNIGFLEVDLILKLRQKVLYSMAIQSIKEFLYYRTGKKLKASIKEA